LEGLVYQAKMVTTEILGHLVFPELVDFMDVLVNKVQGEKLEHKVLLEMTDDRDLLDQRDKPDPLAISDMLVKREEQAMPEKMVLLEAMESLAQEVFLEKLEKLVPPGQRDHRV
jgi:hypothetical protein